MSPLEILFTSIGMAIVTLVCRAFFLRPEEELPLPNWLRRGFNYAPVAALVAVVTPELVMVQGHLIDTWRDPRLFGAIAGMLFYAWRQSLPGTIACGTAVMLVLRFAVGW